MFAAVTILLRTLATAALLCRLIQINRSLLTILGCLLRIHHWRSEALLSSQIWPLAAWKFLCPSRSRVAYPGLPAPVLPLRRCWVPVGCPSRRPLPASHAPSTLQSLVPDWALPTWRGFLRFHRRARDPRHRSYASWEVSAPLFAASHSPILAGFRRFPSATPPSAGPCRLPWELPCSGRSR